MLFRKQGPWSKFPYPPSPTGAAAPSDQPPFRPFQASCGNFVKPTGAAPVVTRVEVGFRVAAAIVWTFGEVTDGSLETQATHAPAQTSFGAFTGVGGDQICGGFAETGAGALGRGSTFKVIRLCDSNGAVVATAAVTKIDDTGFELTWSVNGATTEIFHWAAFGGSSVQARVMHITQGTATGAIPITGAGFQPNLVFTFDSLGIGSYDTNQGGAAKLNLGAASANAQWISAMSSSGAASVFRKQTQTAVADGMGAGGTSSLISAHTSFDPDGETVTVSAGTGGPYAFNALYMKVPQGAVGTFTKSTAGAPVTDTILTGWRPRLVLMTGVHNVASAAVESTAMRMHFGVMTEPAAAPPEETSTWSDPTGAATYALIGKSGVGTFISQGMLVLKVNNGTPVVDAQGQGGLLPNGFSVTWNPNDAVATEYNWLAIGDFDRGVVPPPRIQRRAWANTGRRQRGAWRRRSA